jgi:hypothetical protein
MWKRFVEGPGATRQRERPRADVGGGFAVRPGLSSKVFSGKNSEKGKWLTPVAAIP